MPQSPVAILMLVHDDAEQVHRAFRALAPFPIFVHCDLATPPETFATIARGAGEHVHFVERSATPWGSSELVFAELRCLERALRGSDAEHFVTLSGTDYPMAQPATIESVLSHYGHRSIMVRLPMPFAGWDADGGLDRLRYRYLIVKGRRLRIPLKRAIPKGIVPTGSSVSKILCRAHAERLIKLRDARGDLVRFWRRSWVADETFIATMLTSFVATDASEFVEVSPWYMDWQGGNQMSPKWLDDTDWDRIVAAKATLGEELPLMFARKFSTSTSASLLERVDHELLDRDPAPAEPSDGDGSGAERL